ncbi:CDP-alcohol phosphatidyltransferase family protein [Segeticoccus rhizosphaerae]|uniref:CDP-alcohol phosphatidyltransferase family protein n=1 Tax=Segeticoccus rhizosphaerae TaxID=1104777 RepID=UPI0030831AF4
MRDDVGGPPSQRARPVDGHEGHLVVSNRVLTVPNVLSLLRLVGVPLFLWLLIDGSHTTWAAVVLMVSGVTDYLDGKIARRYGLVTRVGQVLDPLADRLYILATLLGLGWVDAIPWWLVGVLLAREVFIAALGPVLRAHHLPLPPVHFIGKAATFNLLSAFPLILLGQGGSTAATVVQVIGWAFAWWGTVLYWVAGIMYAVHVRQMVRDAAGGRERR